MEPRDGFFCPFNISFDGKLTQNQQQLGGKTAAINIFTIHKQRIQTTPSSTTQFDGPNKNSPCAGRLWVILSSHLFALTNVNLVFKSRFEMGCDFISDHHEFEIIGAYFSPVSDAYAKPGLAPAHHRVKMCELAVLDSNWIMVDPWEATQSV
jgi:hypothetical protein